MPDPEEIFLFGTAGRKKILPGSSSFPASEQQHHACSKSKDADKLGSGKSAHASTDQISPEKLQNKTADTIKDKIARPYLTVRFFPPGNCQQNPEVKEIQNTGINLGWYQRHVVGRKLRIMEGNRKKAVRLSPVAAAGKEASDSPESLGKG